MSRDQNIIRNGNITIGDLSFEEVEKFKYLGATVTNINDTREEIKHRINMGNACYYSVEKLLSSSLLSKNLKVRIYKTVILPVVLYGCETWTLTLREEHRLRVFENKVLRKIFGAKRDEVTGEWRKLHNTELHALYSSSDIIRNIKSRRLRWAGHVARMDESEMHIECRGRVLAVEGFDPSPLCYFLQAVAAPGERLFTSSDAWDSPPVGEMSPGSSTESYSAFARIGLKENPGKNLNQNFYFKPHYPILTYATFALNGSYEGDNAGEMSLGTSTDSYPAFAHIGLRENPGKNLNQIISRSMTFVSRKKSILSRLRTSHNLRDIAQAVALLDNNAEDDPEYAEEEPGGSLPPSNKPVVGPYPEQD
ncbi:hypothetical protein ANN_16515 [Periplaneta americana]|uniref:Uncharacterized protein n=1 Tax=Periplaneta americana TaxID=6978 RepID=A0ABQ8SQL0_PERAM|nr:hypothetical protein ANN_16515 [Periplaneta americana]